MTTHVVQAFKQWGLAACGSSGPWQIDLDETLDGEEWALQFDGPKSFLRFTILDLQVIPSLLAFFQGQNQTERNITLGRFGSAAVSMMQDDEFATRWFIKIVGDTGILLLITLDAADVQWFIEALQQVLEQMPPGGRQARESRQA